MLDFYMLLENVSKYTEAQVPPFDCIFFNFRLNLSYWKFLKPKKLYNIKRYTDTS